MINDLPYTIRSVTQEDAHSLSELFIEFIEKDSDVGMMEEQIALISERPEYYVAGAYIKDKLVGTAMGIVCLDLVGYGKPFLLVENVVVSPHHQGQGIGKGLMHALERFASDNRCNYLLLASSNERVEAHRFYESIGYAGEKRGFMKRVF